MSLKLVTFDTETTGIDTENDRILTCYMRAKDGDKVVFEQNWVIDPGVEVPKESSDVHGMTTQWIRENGRKDVVEAIREISAQLEYHSYTGHVIAGFNSSFDLSILDAEVRRAENGVGLNLGVAPRFLDPVIFSRHFDKFKKGGHKLIDVAKRNGIEVEEDRLHAADYDVEITEKLVPIFLNRAWKELKHLRQGLTPDEFVTKLQEWQANAKKEWAQGLTDWFAKSGKKEDDGSPIVVDGRFPY